MTDRGFGTQYPRRIIPPHFYKPEEVTLMLELDARGFSPKQIVDAMQYELSYLYTPGHWRSSKHKLRARVEKILGERDLWSPYEDEGRIQAALDGSKEAYDALSYYELREVSNRLYKAYQGAGSLTVWCEQVDESTFALATRFSTKRVREDGLSREPRSMRPPTEETRAAIKKAFANGQPNVTKLARELGVCRSTVYRTMGLKK